MISSLFSNGYLNEVDQMPEGAKQVTCQGPGMKVDHARIADGLVVMVESHPRQAWLYETVGKRLREELAKLHVEVNEKKSRK